MLNSMFRVAVIGFAVIVVALLFIAGMLPDISDSLERDSTESVTDTGVACTSDGDGVCELDLSEDHQYGDTRGMTVTETSPGSGDRTGSATLNAADRDSLTVTGLSASTSYQFTVEFRGIADNVNSGQRRIMHAIPLLLLPFLLLMAGMGVIAAFRSMQRQGRVWS